MRLSVPTAVVEQKENNSTHEFLCRNRWESNLPPGAPFCAPARGHLFMPWGHCLETKGHLFVPWGQLFVLLIC